MNILTFQAYDPDNHIDYTRPLMIPASNIISWTPIEAVDGNEWVSLSVGCAEASAIQTRYVKGSMEEVAKIISEPQGTEKEE